jgi:hypothetical protein
MSRIKFLPTWSVLISCYVLLSVSLYGLEETDKLPSVVQTQYEDIMSDFKARTGFQGTYDFVLDNRIFSRLVGTFPLPVPTDSLTARRNFDYILDQIMVIYRSMGINFDFRLSFFTETGINQKNEGEFFQLQFLQVYHNLFILNSINISYFNWFDEYTIDNNLYVNNLTLPARIISPATVEKIIAASAQGKKIKVNPEFVSIDEIADSLRREYMSEEGFETTYSLRIYNDNEFDESKNPDYHLRWVAGNDYELIIIDPETGKVLNTQEWGCD